MFNSTVNELNKYVMENHTEGVEGLALIDLVSFSKNSFHEDQSIFEAAKLLSKKNNSGFPVVNNRGEVVGFLSEKDCLRHLFDDSLNKMPSGKVSDYMTKNVVSFDLQTSIHKVLESFIREPFHCYPVLDGKKYIGVVQRRTMLDALLKRGSEI
jgi:CBS domain-containing protein